MLLCTTARTIFLVRLNGKQHLDMNAAESIVDSVCGRVP